MPVQIEAPEEKQTSKSSRKIPEHTRDGYYRPDIPYAERRARDIAAYGSGVTFALSKRAGKVPKRPDSDGNYTER